MNGGPRKMRPFCSVNDCEHGARYHSRISCMAWWPRASLSRLPVPGVPLAMLRIIAYYAVIVMVAGGGAEKSQYASAGRYGSMLMQNYLVWQ